MKNFIQDGLFVPVKTDKNLKSGDLFVDGNLVGVAVTDSSFHPFTIATRGIFSLPKAEEAIAVGQKLFSKNGDKLTTQEKEATFVGVCVLKAEPGDSRVQTKLS